jgi:hypothetical protein
LTSPKADTTPAKPAAPALDTMAITRLVAAIRSGDIEKVSERFPGMTPQQRSYFMGVVFTPGHTVGKTQPVWHQATITGDTAKMPLDIRVTVIQASTGSPTQLPLRYDAVFALKNKVYALVALNTVTPGSK